MRRHILVCYRLPCECRALFETGRSYNHRRRAASMTEALAHVHPVDQGTTTRHPGTYSTTTRHISQNSCVPRYAYQVQARRKIRSVALPVSAQDTLFYTEASTARSILLLRSLVQRRRTRVRRVSHSDRDSARIVCPPALALMVDEAV